MQPFDPLGRLPRGVTVLEASAGTGKTHTVGALVARYVAEGEASLDQMLVITFGRAASQELRERVRGQLVDVARALADPDEARSEGGLVGHLASVDDHEVQVRRQRVLDALASFDAATIATTHQFCQVVLRSLGVAGDTDPDVQLVEDLDDLIAETVDDLFLAEYGAMQKPPLRHSDLLALARAVVNDPHTALTPTDPAIGSPSQERLRLALKVRSEVDVRKQRRGIMSFDDLLSRLGDSLADPQSPARQRMRSRWSVVLVDEFQDTDPVQWQVLDRAFGGADSTVVLIGDPKQAIYAFRGGDIDSYLAAVSRAGDRRTLGTNHRSDAPLVDALQVLTQQACLGDQRIAVTPVTAVRPDSRLLGAPVSAPVRMRLVDLPSGDEVQPSIAEVREHVARDLADDVARLLTSGATYEVDGQTRPVGAGDVAVLMRSVRQAGSVARELAARGIACVVADRDSVLGSRAAEEWLALLESLDRPAPERVRTVALTSFFGRHAAELDTGGDALTDDLAEQLRDLADVFGQRGVAAVQESLMGTGLAARVLGQPGGERLLTDLEHVGELLHEASHGRGLGLGGLLAWLRVERREAADDTSPAERQRRLDTDSAAVQILTIHASKGLQFPVVMLPYAFDRQIRDAGQDVALRHHGAQAERCLDIGRPHDDAVVARHLAEEAAEELRLTYVALTRAQSQVVIWWSRTWNSVHSGVSRLLLGRSPRQADVPDVIPALESMAEARRRLAVWEEHHGLVVEQTERSGRLVVPSSPDTSPLRVRVLQRTVDTDWRRTSYTGLLRAADGAAPVVLSEPEVAGTVDEQVTEDDDIVLAVDAGSREDAPISPMSDLPAGAGFGSLVHGVLEHADPQAADLAAELTTVAAEQIRWWPVEATVEDLVAGLLPVFDTSLGEIADGARLRDIAVADRLPELDFEIPLAGGDQPGPQVETVRLGQLADVLRRHLEPTDVLATYADHLGGALGEQALRGYLSGSIDAVLRVGPPTDRRYVVVDYKTNRLGVPDRPLTVLDYTPTAMAESMTHSHYPLQALLYSVVLHRYLRWRLADYDPQRHLGGVAYLYVRGMVGAENPEIDGMPSGVFTWRPPAAAIVELSDLLAGHTRQGGA